MMEWQQLKSHNNGFLSEEDTKNLKNKCIINAKPKTDLHINWTV